MKIYNISSIIPLKNLKRENDIILRIQDHLTKEFDFKFTIAKSLPYVALLLSKISKKWNAYYNYQLTERIDVQGYETVIYPWLMPPTSNFWINYFLIPLNWIWFHLIVKKKLGNEAKSAELILSQNLIPDAIVAYWLSKRLDKPFIINLRGDSKTIWFRLPILRKIIQSADAIITHSPTNFNKFKNGYNLKLIPHPVDEIFFNTDQKNQKKIQLLSVCRLLDLKNLDWVLGSLAELKRQGYEFEYKIVGDGPEFENLKHLVTKLELNSEVTFMGYLDREAVAERMHEADIFIMPSYPETLGRVFLEAAAASCLIIGHENTGVDGFFKHEKSAFFINRDNITEYLKKALDIKKSPEFDRIVEASFCKVQDLTWSGIGIEYNELYIGSVE
ncbi:MAG: hypothetical protein CL666_12030 [Balneola sp.]|nr:hypothetical protein [Balneola sp.]|tara:strand:- start:15003 stop:16166 length:1164 start_codon:yes stop_codon:yes gene_type:complete